ncbi:MAG TPA: LacI family DNA-binding transcriptional regulator [Actinophytocola sp.]|uniref:LacI family DNA-binding transcriptional regulator n=1 Tax=Actinophytocola sp. TaxID=1872138 RepID=UPI002DB91EDC|nr:LacI family DNA-binding transcriptional regulator [Actinophytocola sp.]HEU5473450.1 LacI family DNA-binding transcriptional regulator [Actinophytocola sp.]
MSTPGRRVTSAEVAKHSGVSRATVSYVLNGNPNQSISSQTRQRVLDAAERLGYTPSAPARALRSGRSDVVLFLLPEWPIGPTIARLVEDLTRSLAASRLTLLLHTHPRSARPVADLWKAITPAAVINHQALTDDEVQVIRRAGIPVIAPSYQLGGAATFADFQHAIGRTQVEHLAATGHRRLGFALPDDDRLLAFAQPRLDGARRACTRLGLDHPATQTVSLSAHSATQAIDYWRRTPPRITGICAYNDEVALAILAGMRTRRLAAPHHLAVIGVDNIPAGALTDPALTTITTGMSALGQHLATAVVNTLAGKPIEPGPDQDLLQLIRRDSA